MTSKPLSAQQNYVIAATMAFMGITLWMLGRTYQGIFHDACLYAFQGLARLDPASLGQDVFLKFVSQDAYTIFSPVYAWFIARLGLEDAARVLTLVGHAWWLAAAFAIARIVLGPRKAWLAIAILAGLPGYYGPWHVFRYAEPFLTPRLYAEAAVLTSIAFAMVGRRMAAIGFAALAMSLHPIIAAGGALVSAVLIAPQRLKRAVPALILVGLGLACTIAVLAPHYPLSRFDDEWLALVRMRSPFLLMADWNEDAWMSVATPLVGLWILGTALTDGLSRRLFVSAALIGGLGLVITAVGADLFKVVLLTQGQGWRWTWVASALLATAAVGGVPAAWRGGPLHRSALALLLSGLLLRGLPATAILVTALLAWQCRRCALPMGVSRAIFLGTLAIGCASTYVWISGIPTLLSVDPSDPLGQHMLLRMRHLISDGVVPTLVILVLWLWITRTPRLAGIALVCAIVATTTVAFATSPKWRRTIYEPENKGDFIAWERVIPTDAEVFWPEDPVNAWFLLRRRHYVSRGQTAGIVYSRAAAMAMRQRATETRLIISPGIAFGAGDDIGAWAFTSQDLEDTCRRSHIDFVVTTYRFDLPMAANSIRFLDRLTGIEKGLFLYDCRPLRSASISDLEPIA